MVSVELKPVAGEVGAKVLPLLPIAPFTSNSSCSLLCRRHSLSQYSAKTALLASMSRRKGAVVTGTEDWSAGQHLVQLGETMVIFRGPQEGFDFLKDVMQGAGNL